MDLSIKHTKLGQSLGQGEKHQNSPDKNKTEATRTKGSFRDQINCLISSKCIQNKQSKQGNRMYILLLVGLLIGLSKANDELTSQIPTASSSSLAPSQLFLAPTTTPAISLVSGLGNGKSLENDDDRFIMRSSSGDSSDETTDDRATNESPATETSSHLLTVGESQESTDQPSPVATDYPPEADQSIPIDVNRQQFVTHDQLNDHRTGSRSGASRVSHVSSFLSDLFAYATRPRQTGAEANSMTQTNRPHDQQTVAQDKSNDESTVKPQSLSSASSCPGVCRSILTAPILCRNEISAPCPLFLQKCCEKDEVSFNGTPVETSAPIIATQEADLSTQSPVQTTTTTPKSQITTESTEPKIGEQRQAITLATVQPLATLYFISSSNGSLASVQPAKPELAAASSSTQSQLAEEQASTKPASQSFDRQPDETRTKSTDLTTVSSTSLAPVVLQTANGTVVHRPSTSDSAPKVRLRPAYANWTDYQLAMLQGKPLQGSHPVVYHSNLDPVKRFGERASSTSTMAPIVSSLPTTVSSVPITTTTTVQATTTVLATTESTAGCTGNCLAKSQLQLCKQAAHGSANTTTSLCPDSGEFCCLVLADGADSAATSIKRTLALPSGSNNQDLVINDQHSSSNAVKSRYQSNSISSTTTTSTTPSPSNELRDSTSNQDNSATGSGSSGAIGIVGNVLVDLLDSWISGSSSSTSNSVPSEAQSSNEQANEQVKHKPVDEQDSERPYGPDLSFRQQTSGEHMTDKCAGYCTMNLFTMLCDSTHLSADCGPSQKCCISGSRGITTTGNEMSLATDDPEQRQPDKTQFQDSQELGACRGTCLPVYHSSLCTKPNEIYASSTSCLPNHICCTKPESSSMDPNQSDEQLDSAATASEPQSSTVGSSTSAGDFAKELLASLLPPLPPSLATDKGDQHPGPRPRPVPSNIDLPTYQPATTPAPKAKQPESTGGFMSHIYQMFKSSNKHKQSTAQQPTTTTVQMTQLPVQVYDYYNRVPATTQQLYNQQPQLILSPSLLDAVQLQNAANFYAPVSLADPVEPIQPVAKPQVNAAKARAPWQAQYAFSEAPQISPQILQQQVPVMQPQQTHVQPQQPPQVSNYRPPSGQPMAAAASQPQVFHVGGHQSVQQLQPQQTMHHTGNNNPRLVASNSDYLLAQGSHIAPGYQQQTGQTQRRYQQQQQPAKQQPMRTVPQQPSNYQVMQQPAPSVQQQQQQRPLVNRRNQADSRPTAGLPLIGSSPSSAPVAQNMTKSIESHPISSHQTTMDNALVVAPQPPITQSAQNNQPRPKQQQNNLQRHPSQQQNQHQQSLSSFAASDARTLSKEITILKEELATGGQQQTEIRRPPAPVSSVNKLQSHNNPISQAKQTGTPSTTGASSEPERSPTVESSVVARSQATTCGITGGRRRSSGARIMGGSDAKPGHWCWQVALMNNKNEYLCGGALIGSKWVLTAAHCITQHVRSENQLYVRLGQHDLNSTETSENSNVMSILVRTSYVHHNHNGITLDNDIALLRLEEPADLSDPSSICMICLPERSSQVEPGKRCMVTGYGYKDEEGPAALKVRQVELPIVSDQECQKKTGAVLDRPFTLPASSFCAGGELGQDACHGDGGSPLACMVNGYYELAGIVSWGYKCGQDSPGLYSKVSTFVGWINQIVSVNN